MLDSLPRRADQRSLNVRYNSLERSRSPASSAPSASQTSAAEVWEALGALEAGDLDRSSELYRTLSERWSALRGRESSN